MKLKLFLSSRFVSGSQVSLSQSIVRFFERLIDFPTDLFRSNFFPTDFDRLLIRGNRAREIRALRIENPQLQIRGAELRIKTHRLLQQRLHASRTLIVTVHRSRRLFPKTNGVIVVRKRIVRLQLRESRQSLHRTFRWSRLRALHSSEKQVG